MTTTPRYILGEDRAETQRLSEQAAWDDAGARARRAGLRPGMRVVDAGCGPGVVARQLAAIAGPTGSVIGFDLSEERLTSARTAPVAEGSAPLEFRAGNLLSPPVEEGTADFVWCQYVLEYLPQPQLAVDALARLLAPGGRLVIVDVDGIGLGHHPQPDSVAQGLDRLVTTLGATGFDPYVGRKLFSFVRAAGLEDATAWVEPYRVVAGAAPPDEREAWRQRFSALASFGHEAFGGAARYDAFTNDYLHMLDDPGGFHFSLTMVATGTRR